MGLGYPQPEQKRSTVTRGAWDGQGAAVTEEEAAGGPWAALYEREDELAALAEARAGTGGLVVVEGPAGIGKSRLLAEARADAAGRGMTVLTARGTDLEREAPFGVVAELFAAVRTATPGTAVQGTVVSLRSLLPHLTRGSGTRPDLLPRRP
jgi:predicted ATPase